MKIAVIIPCFKVKNHILDVIGKIGDEVHSIYCVDDACPDLSGKYITDNCDDPRVKVIFNEKNGGVGFATNIGFLRAIRDNVDILVKIDGDGQMDPLNIPNLIHNIVDRKADMCKGNRLFNQSFFRIMPPIRIFGNAVLSFMVKITTGYWNIVDPTNGFFAIHASVYKEIDQKNIENRFLFETSILFNLSLLGAVVNDIPIKASYGSEVSNLKVRNVIFPFLKFHFLKLHKRIIIIHFLRGFSVASLELLFGSILLIFGTFYGFSKFFQDYLDPFSVTAGQVMLAALPIIIGVQFIVSFLRHDYNLQPSNPIYPNLIIYFKDKKQT